MAVRSVIDIQVNDEQFRKFTEMFNAYQEKLAATPDAWAKVGTESTQTTLTFEKMAALLLAQSELSHQVAVHQVSAGTAAGTQARHWEGMARSARTVAGHIASATRQLLRWTALTSVFTGLLGAGGLFGIERLATSAAGYRRSSLGLGLSIGEQRSFGLNYGRVVDPGSFLGGVNEALHDVTKRVGLLGAGMTEQDLHGKNTGQVAADLLPKLKAIADQTPDAMLAQVLQARRLDQFISLEEFQRLKATPQAELNQYGRQFRTDVERLNLSRQEAKAWQDLRVQLSRAGESIETTFIKGLSPLAPELEKLSAAFTKAVGDLLASPQIKEWIVDLGEGIKWLATYLQTDAFRENVTAFVRDVGLLATAIGHALHTVATWVTVDDKPAAKPGEPGAEPAPSPGTLPGWHMGPGGWTRGPFSEPIPLPSAPTPEAPGAAAPPGTLPGWHFGPGGALISPAPNISPAPPEAPGEHHWWDPRTWRTHPVAPGAPDLWDPIPRATPGEHHWWDPRTWRTHPVAPGAPDLWDPIPRATPGEHHWWDPRTWRTHPVAPGAPDLWDPIPRATPGAFNAGQREASPLLQQAAYRVPAGLGTSDAEQHAHDFFRSQGWSEAATSGLLANFRGESGLSAAAFNPAGGGQGAQGIAQWRGDRLDNFRRMFGHDPRYGTLDEQLQFAQWELTQGPERGTGLALRGMTSAASAAAEVLRSYERPSARELPGLEQQRGAYAEGYARRFNVQPAAGGAQPRGNNVMITIQNNTGGNSVVTASQLAV